MKLGLLKGLTVAVAALLLAGCAAMRCHKGAVIDRSSPARSSRASTTRLRSKSCSAARPSPAQFTPNDWYYVSRDTDQLAFRNPRGQRQTVLLVRFDQAGNVASVQHTGKELVMNLEPSRRSTPTLGRKKSFFEELFGNIGSVSAGGLPAAASTAR